MNSSKEVSISFRTYCVPSQCFPVTLDSTESREIRSLWLQRLGLHRFPFLLPEASVPHNEFVVPSPSICRLVNPHLKVVSALRRESKRDEKILTIFGAYEYYHYMQDGINDSGWGCCYRTLQTVISWYQLQHLTNKPVPTIWEIQKLLKKHDTLRADLEVGSKTWIGTQEGSYAIMWYLGYATRSLHCSSVEDMSSHTSVFEDHFRRVGSPVMMGVGDLAFGLVGISVDDKTGDTSYLVVDPHYTGADNIKSVIDGKWVGWKKISFFKERSKGSFINICMPLTVTDAGGLWVY